MVGRTPDLAGRTRKRGHRVDISHGAGDQSHSRHVTDRVRRQCVLADRYRHRCERVAGCGRSPDELSLPRRHRWPRGKRDDHAVVDRERHSRRHVTTLPQHSPIRRGIADQFGGSQHDKYRICCRCNVHLASGGRKRRRYDLPNVRERAFGRLSMARGI